MTITNQNLDIYRGDEVRFFVQLVDALGAPFDGATASSIRWRLATNANSLESLINKDLGSGISLAEGGVDIVLNASDTDLQTGIYYHELKIYGSAFGSVSTALTGNVIVRPALSMGEVVQAQMTLSGQAAFRATP